MYTAARRNIYQLPGIDKLVYVSTGVPHGSHAGYRFCPKELVLVRPYESERSSKEERGVELFGA